MYKAAPSSGGQKVELQHQQTPCGGEQWHHILCVTIHLSNICPKLAPCVTSCNFLTNVYRRYFKLEYMNTINYAYTYFLGNIWINSTCMYVWCKTKSFEVIIFVAFAVENIDWKCLPCVAFKCPWNALHSQAVRKQKVIKHGHFDRTTWILQPPVLKRLLL